MHPIRNVGLAVFVAVFGSCASSDTTKAPPEPASAAPAAAPDTLLLTGMPLFLSGWNGTYNKTTQRKNGRPVWERPEHWYGSLITMRIIGVKIWFDGEAWILHRDGDPETNSWARSSHGGESPVGDWDGGHVKVEPFRPVTENSPPLRPARNH